MDGSDLILSQEEISIPKKIYKKRGSYLDKQSNDFDLDGRTKIPQAGAPLNSGGFQGGFNNNGKHICRD